MDVVEAGRTQRDVANAGGAKSPECRLTDIVVDERAHGLATFREGNGVAHQAGLDEPEVVSTSACGGAEAGAVVRTGREHADVHRRAVLPSRRRPVSVSSPAAVSRRDDSASDLGRAI